MRDDFYHWLYMAIAFTLLCGGSIARALDGKAQLLEPVTLGLIAAASTIGVIDHYRKK